MPTLGRDFLQALTNPPINQGLFNLGSAVGGMPGQYKAQKKEEVEKASQSAVAKASCQVFLNKTLINLWRRLNNYVLPVNQKKPYS